MMIYLYETVPGSEGGEVCRYEIKQSIHDAALTHHPETGAPIRRVILGGLGLITGKSKRPQAPAPQPARRGCGCGSGGCGH
ncbi:MAG: zinc ribbon domain-containing protein [Verrucomicrobiaceae bacterium]|nr:MAG: zinc ribbon domain-containing protein [Verrucomicrobiaceae bacterium]